MDKHQLEHLLRAASVITQESKFYVVGTAAIVPWLDSIRNSNDILVRSREADLIPASGSVKAVDLIDGALGLESTFDETYGYHADGVEFSTVANAPAKWRDRAREFASPNTNGAVGLCMEPHDLAIAKLCAGRQKDHEFVDALLTTGLVDCRLLLERLEEVSAPTVVLDRVRRWVTARLKRENLPPG